MKKLNLGCGDHIIDGWLNVDYSFGAFLNKVPIVKFLAQKVLRTNWNKKIFIHNLSKKFPWEDNSVDYIYTSHTLEHFDREEGLHFLSESYRVLKLGGIIRILVPDLEVAIKKYLDKEIKAEYFIERLGVLTKKSNSRLKNILYKFISYPHKCMYDEQSLIRILQEIGFKAKRKNGFESEIANIDNVELQSRAYNSLIIEAEKV